VSNTSQLIKEVKMCRLFVSGMEVNKNDSISGSECEDNCLREIGAVGWECCGD
jgi:hypothetical protein